MLRLVLFSLILISFSGFGQEFNPGSVSNRVAINDAGDYIVFQSNLQSGYQLYETYPVNGKWITPKAINEVNLPFHGLHSMGHVTLNSDASIMVFSARTDNSDKFDLFYSTRNNGFWSTPISIKALNGLESEIYPTFHTNNTTLYFLRNPSNNDTCMAIYSSNMTLKESNKNSTSNEYEFSKPTLLTDGCFKGIEFFKDGKTLWTRGTTIMDTTLQNVHITNKLPFSYNKKVFQLTSALDDTKWYISDGKSIQIHTIKPNEHMMGLWYTSTISFEDASKNGETVMVYLKSKKGFTDSVKIKDKFTYYKAASDDDTIIVSYNYQAYQTLYDTILISKRQSMKNQTGTFQFKKKKKKYVFNIADSENDNTNLSGKIKVVNAVTGEEVWLEKDPNSKGGYSVYLNEGEEYSVEVTNVKGYTYKNENIKVKIGGSDETAVVKKVEVEKLVVGKNFELKNIYYDYNSYVLSDSSAKELNLLLELMEVNPEMKIRIEAHTDSKGKMEYNIELSKKRAQSVVDYLVSKGIAVERLDAVGLGSAQPRVKEVDEATQALNRRVEIKIQAI